MGRKISPTSFRVGINKGWASRWFSNRKYVQYLKDDVAVRDFLNQKLKNMAVDRIEIERGNDMLNVLIYTARPGLIIGRGGTGVEEIKSAINSLLKKKIGVRVEIQEFKNPEASASIMAESIADQLEKRIAFRRIMKQTLSKIIANKDVDGAKIQLGGRLNGAEIARVEHLEQGKLPLQTIRADIDFAKATAATTYGTIGVKVWIYKGEVFDKQ